MLLPMMLLLLLRTVMKLGSSILREFLFGLCIICATLVAAAARCMTRVAPAAGAIVIGRVTILELTDALWLKAEQDHLKYKVMRS
jgi:hypothetical protein